MANQSAMHTNVVNVRAAGSKDATTGLQMGGIYYPENRRADGKIIPAKWEGQFFVNQLGWTDSDGKYHDPKNLPIRITAWNGKNAADGKGMADVFAKCVSKGKELSAVLRMDFYEKRLFIANVPQTDHLGQPIKIPAYGWLIKSDLQWGSDANALIADEISKWQGQANFFSRPPQWNTQGHPDNEAWKAVVAQRMATTFNGQPTYGYARVMVPEGATIVNKAGQQIVMQSVNHNQAPPLANGTVPPPPAPPAGQVPPPPAAGPTYEQLLAAGWAPAQIAAQAEYAHLTPAAGTIGAPPTSAAAGMGGTPLSNPTGL